MRNEKLSWIWLTLGLGTLGALNALGCKSSSDGNTNGNDAGTNSGGSDSGGAGGNAGSVSHNGGASGSSANGGTGGNHEAGGGAAGQGGDTSGAGGTAAGGASDAGAHSDGGDGGSQSNVSFFITSTGSMTGNLGGLAGADAKCATLAAAAGFGGKTWHAYLSVEHGPNGTPVNARDRIGQGPWYNVKGVLLAADLTALHALNGDYQLFLDENGVPVPGQWVGSPAPVQHDILTGTNRDGTLDPGYTCSDWTSESATETAWVGHTDGLGPNVSMDAMYRPWNSVHENGGCNDTAPRGGAGRIACFAVGN